MNGLFYFSDHKNDQSDQCGRYKRRTNRQLQINVESITEASLIQYYDLVDYDLQQLAIVDLLLKRSGEKCQSSFMLQLKIYVSLSNFD